MSKKNVKGEAINKHYDELLKQDNGAKFVKVDLHVHTPSSKDAQAKNKYNFKFNTKKRDLSRKNAEALAEDIVKRCKELEIRLIAVTDHNSPSNVDPLALGDTWYELLQNAASEMKENGVCILPGVEISTDDLHILVIVDPIEGPQKKNEEPEVQPAAYIVHKINFLLRKCGFTLPEYGDYTATGTSSLFDVLEHIKDLGMRCIAIPAHIDGGKKAMLEVYDKPSNVYPKLLNHPYLNAVEVTKHTTPTNKKFGPGKKAINVKDYFASKREPQRSRIAWIQNSDGHSIKDKGLGWRFSYIRMGKPSFTSLKNALEDPDTRVRMRNEYTGKSDKTMIRGIAFRKGSGQWSYIAFNPNLNCIVGKKATHKSTIVDLILYGVDRFHDDEKDTEKELIDKGYSVEVFIEKDSDVFCCCRSKEGTSPSWFKLGPTKKEFVKLDEKPVELALPRKYHHKGITGRFSDKTRLMEFIDWDVLSNFKSIEKCLEKCNKYLEKMKEKGYVISSPDRKQLKKACQALFEKRQSIKKQTEKKVKSKSKSNEVEIPLPQYGKKGDESMFKVRVKKAKYTGNTRSDYIDQASLYVLDEKKYKSFDRLSTGDKNATIMTFLMNQDSFGPLIIDEPEQYLDVSSITKKLVPRMRQLKTEQQIICVTKDEHILLSGDAENVVVTQSEKEIDVINGDINDRKIQHEVLEIFEGDNEGKSLQDKNRKLAAILGQS